MAEDTTRKIHFKRKVIPEKTLLDMMDVYKAEHMVTGSAFKMVTEDLLNLRRLCDLMVKAKDNDDIPELNHFVDILKVYL